MRKFRQLSQQFVILRKTLAEADAWINHDLRSRHAALSRAVQSSVRSPLRTSFITSRANGPFCMVRGVPRMCIRMSGAPCLAATSRQFRIAAQPRNVVDDFRASSQRDFRHRRLLRIHRNGNLQFAAQRLQHRQQPRAVPPLRKSASEPGRVDSAPISMMSAPSRCIASACCDRALRQQENCRHRKNCPASHSTRP